MVTRARERHGAPDSAFLLAMRKAHDGDDVPERTLCRFHVHKDRLAVAFAVAAEDMYAWPDDEVKPNPVTEVRDRALVLSGGEMVQELARWPDKATV
jgi:hypothetical protein